MADKEYIERGALLDEISAILFGSHDIDLARSVVKYAPAADVVEVVRCKDCAYYREENGYCMNPHCGKSYYGCPVRENHYCSFGEREEQI